MSFKKIQNNIVTALKAELDKKKINPLDFAAYLTIFSKAENEHELRLMLEIFAKDDDGLMSILSKELEIEQDHEESELNVLLKKILISDPKLSAKIAKAVKTAEVKNVEEILAKFPEVNNHL